MSRQSPVPRSQSRASVAASVTTYHSFQDVELYEPTTTTMSARMTPYVDPDPPTPPLSKLEPELGAGQAMRRQDSGYESLPSRPSRSRQRTSSSVSPPVSRSRKRPSMHRAVKSGPVAHIPRTTAQPIYLTRSHQSHKQNTFFHFPAPETPFRQSIDGQALVLASGADLSDHNEHGYQYDNSPSRPVEAPTYTPPPQTTHYWTSDSTRRLEYAAIDAASRGVRGWFLKHMVPECFVPKERRRLRFEDDRGSVRRYRIELECDESGAGKDCCGGHPRKKGLWKSLKGN